MKVVRMLILVCFAVGFSVPQYVGRTIPLYFNCTNNPVTCVNPICGYAKLDNNRMNISFGCTLLKPMRKVSARLKEFNQRPKSKWKPTTVDLTLDICELSSNMNTPMVKMFMHDIMDTLGQFIHPCPYEGRFVARNITFTGGFMQMYPKGTKIRTELTLSDIKYMNFATLYMYHEVT